ncbi:NAD(P)-binding domain-containing protein [Dactylosporangium sp. CS-047395]|uniref:flavin-containing monooxygenase n=1 Tax=Dactylosporangium sp. CS-047395 TaxID=3239936 RepID=UPI003D8F328A
MLDKPVVVIGAGPAGLATVKALRDRQVPVLCLDAGERPGGLWVLGAPNSSAYRTLHLNTSRTRTEFADFPMPADWPDYPSHTHIADYLASYVATYDLTDAIRFGVTVTAVEPITTVEPITGFDPAAVHPTAVHPAAAVSPAATVESAADVDPITTAHPNADAGSAATVEPITIVHPTVDTAVGVEPAASVGPSTVGGMSSTRGRAVGQGWRVTLAGGETIEASAVVVASGHNAVPKTPEPAYPGTFAGEFLHSHDYRGPEQLAGRRVLVVGGGNSAMDIAVDASHVADSTLLSLRRGVWIVPKHLLGRPADTWNGAMARRLPWRLRQRVSERLLRLAVGRPEQYGLPAPAHGFLQDHPTLSDGLLGRITHGEIGVRPAIERFEESNVCFIDGSRDAVDLVVWCTGYRVDLPFLDPALLAPGPDRLPLYRRIFHLDAPGLFFVGLMQSTGAALPVVEAQARLVAAFLARQYALPAPAEQRADCARRLTAARDRWGDRRPAMRIDFDVYLAEAAHELRQGARRLSSPGSVTWH